MYNNHINQVQDQLTRVPRSFPRMILNPEKRDLFAFEVSDFILQDYDPYPAISAPIAV